jgi:hypothetical protein
LIQKILMHKLIAWLDLQEGNKNGKEENDW